MLCALVLAGCDLMDEPSPTVLEGSVLDYPSRAPLAGALVRWGERTIPVDATGSFVLQDVGSDITLRFWAPGHPIVSHRYRLGVGETRVVEVPLAPEGTQLPSQPVLFERDGRIWIAEADGADERCLTADLPGTQVTPSWLLGRSQFAFILRVPSRTQIWTRYPDGRSARFVAEVPDSADELTWHPLGARMGFTSSVFSVSRGMTTSIRQLDVNTGLVTELLAGATDANPIWSRDGQSLAWARRVSPKPWQVWIGGSRGEHAHMFTTRGSCVEPAWSPSGEQLVYASNAGGAWDLYLAGVSTGVNEPITHVPADAWCRRPVWGPEGDEILFESNYHPILQRLIDPPGLFALRLATGAVRAVVSDARRASW